MLKKSELLVLIFILNGCSGMKVANEMRGKYEPTVVAVSSTPEETTEKIKHFLKKCYDRFTATTSTNEYGGSSVMHTGIKSFYQLNEEDNSYEIQVRSIAKKPPILRTDGHIYSLVDVSPSSPGSKVSIYGYGKNYLTSFPEKLLNGYKIVLGKMDGVPHCPNISK